jgi:plastocyanin
MENQQRARSTIGRSVWIWMIGTAALVLVVGCQSDTTSVNSAATATTRFSEGMEGLQGGVERGMPPTVTMTDALQFEPSQVSVRVGAPVRWRNNSAVAHTVTADPSRVQTADHVQLPAGVEPFESESVPPGQVFTRQFTVAGEYRYVCRIHEGSGMVGIITVE